MTDNWPLRPTPPIVIEGETLPKPGTGTRLAKKLGLTMARAHLIRREMQRRLPAVPVDTAAAKKLAVFPRLGVVYNRIQKNANTTTMLLLDALEVGYLRTIPESKGQHLLFYQAWATGRFSLAGARYLVVARSPYSRAVSAFLFKFKNWQSVARARYGREFEISAAGFHDFLLWLKDGALTRDQHWDLQVSSLALPAPVFTDVIHLESYEPQMRAFLAKTRRAAAVDGFDFDEIRRLGSPHATGTQAQRGDYLTPENRRLVSEIYAADFAAFGYDPG
jgi:hypothetical protein